MVNFLWIWGGKQGTRLYAHIAGRKFRYFGIFANRSERNNGLGFIVIHLERFRADDLEPVDHAFGACEGVQMGIGAKFLGGRDIFGLPAEEKRKPHVDYADEDGRVED